LAWPPAPDRAAETASNRKRSRFDPNMRGSILRSGINRSERGQFWVKSQQAEFRCRRSAHSPERRSRPGGSAPRCCGKGRSQWIALGPELERVVHGLRPQMRSNAIFDLASLPVWRPDGRGGEGPLARRDYPWNDTGELAASSHFQLAHSTGGKGKTRKWNLHLKPFPPAASSEGHGVKSAQPRSVALAAFVLLPWGAGPACRQRVGIFPMPACPCREHIVD